MALKTALPVSDFFDEQKISPELLRKREENVRMRYTKRFFSLILILSSVALLCAWSSFRDEDGQGGANVVSAPTPVNTQKGGTVWTRRFSANGTTGYNSSPVITDSSLYIANSGTLYELDLQGKIKRQISLSAKMNSVCQMLRHGDFLYLPLSGGRMECIRLSTMQSVWTSEEFGGQSLSTVYYHEGFLYAGTTAMAGADATTGLFYCLNAADGKTVWRYQNTEKPGGYYWSGAVSCGDAVFFAGDNGELVSHSLTTDEVYETVTLTSSAKIRAGITRDRSPGTLYTAATDGTIYKITVSEKGHILGVRSGLCVPDAKNLYCTSTPTVWNGRLYVGCIADSYGCLSVLDADTLSARYAARGQKNAEIKSSPLVSTACANPANGQKVYVYFTCNIIPGGLYYIADSETAAGAKIETLYEPVSARQYCLSSVACGNDGTLYYSNDSGTLFAVREVDVSSDAVPAADSETAKKKTASNKKSKPLSPVKIRYTFQPKKKSFLLRWKKKTSGSRTVLLIRYGHGKWQKKVLSSGKSSARIKLKGKKKIYIRLQSRIRSGRKWLHSSPTKIYRLKK